MFSPRFEIEEYPREFLVVQFGASRRTARAFLKANGWTRALLEEALRKLCAA